jgi:Prasinovirus endonuclease VII
MDQEPKYGEVRADGYIFDGWTIKKGKRYQAWRSSAAMAKRLAVKLQRLKRSSFDLEKLASIRKDDAERQRIRRAEKGDLINAQRRAAYEINGAAIRKKNLKWRKKNWAQVAESRRRPQYAIASIGRAKVLRLLKLQKSPRAEQLIGCSMEEFKRHLESLFKPGMAWNNHGRTGWQIDHIRPCSSFNLLDREELMKCFHYTNLQPLWGKENMSKGTKNMATR